MICSERSRIVRSWREAAAKKKIACFLNLSSKRRNTLVRELAPLGDESALGQVTLEDLEALDEHATTMMERIKAAVFKPTGGKNPPSFNATQLAALCNRTHPAMLRLLDKAPEWGLSTGVVMDAAGKKLSAHRSFSLEETIDWVRHLGNAGGLRYQRQGEQPGAVITVGFFKGGVGKTVIATSLAQGLSLKGYKVLAIDFDPQGSMTALLGGNPAAVEQDETFTPLALPPSSQGHRDSLVESIRPTYWSGVDVIAGSTGLFACEFYLPLRAMNAQAEGKRFNFLEVLQRALDPIRAEYDYIIIDTPPALSYTTMNAYWAADAILMPIVPEGLSLQSSVQFWNMFTELASTARQLSGIPKTYAWLGVVPSRVEGHKAPVQEMLKWIRMFYGEYVMTSEIPLTETIKTGSTEFATVYDIEKYVGGAKTYERARVAFDKLVTEVDLMTRRNFWRERSEEA